MEDEKEISWEYAQVEYETAMEQIRSHSSLRRADLMFATTVQGAILAIVGSNLLSLRNTDTILTVLACFVALISVNAERRIYAHMKGYGKRAHEIEHMFGMALYDAVIDETRKTKPEIPNAHSFTAYYVSLVAMWVFIWVVNVVLATLGG